MSGKRAALDAETRARHSLEISRRLCALKEFEKSGNVMFYLSLEKEVQTEKMIEYSFQAGKAVYVPVVDKAARSLEVVELPGLDIQFEIGAFGIREPVKSLRKTVPRTRVDFVVTPGLAFDFEGGRIGFGEGYYDQLLKELPPSATRVGVVFDFQVVDSVPQLENDERVHFIITEKKTIDCRIHRDRESVF